ncbi:MAG: hypothetical protein ACK4FR_11440, partial [Tabrizicola sp.]
MAIGPSWKFHHADHAANAIHAMQTVSEISYQRLDEPNGGIRGGHGMTPILTTLAPGLMEAGSRLIDRLVPDPAEREKAKL